MKTGKTAKVLRAPLLHFLLLGGGLFALDVVMLSAVLYWTVLCMRRSRS